MIPGLVQWVKDPVFPCVVSDAARLWSRPAAVAQIRALAWELSYVAGVALKRKKKKKNMSMKNRPRYTGS